MRKLFVLIAIIAVIAALSSASFADTRYHKNLLLNRIVVIEDTPVVSHISVENDRELDFDDGKVVLSIPELGVRSARNLDLGSGRRDSKAVLLDIPDGVKGEYYVRIVVTNEDVKRVRHRLITIE